MTFNVDWATSMPVGSVYVSINEINPSIYFGGTWEAFAKGKTLIGVDSDDTDFNVSQKTGGEKTHTLTVEEMPSHKHKLPLLPVKNTRSEPAFAGDMNMIVQTDNPGGDRESLTTGGGEAHNNLQPYITVYMWVRTA